MKPHDEDVPASPDEIAWEQERWATLRSFAVVLHDGSVEHVFAHFWSNETPAGHLNFFTVEPSGRQLIRDAFSVGEWVRVREITPPDVAQVREITPPDVAQRIDRIASAHSRKRAGDKAIERHRQKTSSWSIH